MTLPASGAISIGMAAAELGLGLPLSLGDPRVRALAGVPSGPISLGQLHGKSASVPPPPPPPAPTLSVTAVNASNSAQTQLGSGSVSCSPSVQITGGVDPKSCAWSVLSNPNGATVTLGSSTFATVRSSYSKNSSGFASVTLRCAVTDGAGTKLTVDLSGDLEWASDA
jgi:hypothetical protein